VSDIDVLLTGTKPFDP